MPITDIYDFIAKNGRPLTFIKISLYSYFGAKKAAALHSHIGFFITLICLKNL